MRHDHKNNTNNFGCLSLRSGAICGQDIQRRVRLRSDVPFYF